MIPRFVENSINVSLFKVVTTKECSKIIVDSTLNESMTRLLPTKKKNNNEFDIDNNCSNSEILNVINPIDETKDETIKFDCTLDQSSIKNDSDDEYEHISVVNENDPVHTAVRKLLLSTKDTDLTTILCDHSPNEDTLKYFLSFSNIYTVIDARKLHLDYHVRRLPIDIIFEDIRFRLVYAMKSGKTLVIRMGDTTVDFLNIFNDTSAAKLRNSKLIMIDPRPPHPEWAYFPSEILYKKGKLLLQAPWPERLLRRQDRTDALKVDVTVNPSFNVIITTNYHIDKLDNYLFTGNFGLPPKTNFQPIIYE